MISTSNWKPRMGCTIGGKLTSILAAAICIATLVPTANATPIVYTFSGIDSGSVGTRSFGGAPFSINVYADTANVVSEPFRLYTIEASTATFTIAGIGTGVFTMGTRVFDRGGPSQALGFSLSAALGGYDLWDFNASEFWEYDLTTALGPINAGPALGSPNLTSQPTTLGNLTFNYAPNITFTASLVPEPSIFCLCAAALSAMAQIYGRFGSRRAAMI